MDRQICYIGAIPQDIDLLLTNKNTMVGLGYLIQAILGANIAVDGLACTPTSPATMTVNVANGSIYAIQNIDGSAYGSLASDTAHQIMKQGIVLGTTNFSCPAPVTSGQSIVYLVEAIYQDLDGGSTVLPYYNSSNPAVPFNGPGNTGVSQNTVRQGICRLQLKAGVAATTGTQVTPSPDAGYTGLWAITVANGATTITSGNIVQVATAPFISTKLQNIISAVQAGAFNYAADSSGSANTITASLSPNITSYTAGLNVAIKVANTTTSSTSNINLNGIGNAAVYGTDGNPLHAGALKANGVYGFIYDGAHFVLQGSPADLMQLFGSFKNLKIVTTSNTSSTITADELIVEDANGNTRRLPTVNQSYATGTSGAGGLDTGAIANNTWYYEFIIYNPATNTQKALLSLSATAPTLPSGYTYFTRVGAIFYGSGVLLYKIQYGRDAQYIVGTSPATPVSIASGSSGSVTIPTYTAVSISSVVPPTAAKAKTQLTVTGNSVAALLAPNANYGALASSNVYLASCLYGGSAEGQAVVTDIVLESTNLYYAASAAAASAVILGWTDNI